jgi:hypothetical protein
VRLVGANSLVARTGVGSTPPDHRSTADLLWAYRSRMAKVGPRWSTVDTLSAAIDESEAW